MHTKLTYRFPNGEVVSKTGVFKSLVNPEKFEGFILSDFEGCKFFGFYENEEDEQEDNQDAPIVISESAYCSLAHEFIHYLQDHSIGKAVLSRVKHVNFDASDRLELFHRLIEKYPAAFCYTFDSPSLGTWIGATPETLVKIESGRGETMSLAGTKSAQDNAEWGSKEQHEQQLVTDFISGQLKESCENIEVFERKELIAGPVKHLVHQFQFEVKQENQWQLISNLHPTPAVSGFPRIDALKCIELFEPHSRKFYAGIIGYLSTKKTHLFVNLRSAEIQNNDLFLYVGGGLTQQSIPEDEWLETENKAKTITQLL